MTIMRARAFGFQSLSFPSHRPYTTPWVCFRCLHQQVSAQDVPSPTPFVPDSKTFLTLIGRNLLQYAIKIPSWHALFSLKSEQLRELGVEPASNRRYLLWWRDRFKKGIYGIGGDLREVVDGTAKLAVVNVVKSSQKGLDYKKKLVVNVPIDAKDASTVTDPKPVKGMKVRGAQTICGPYVQPVKTTGGSVALIKVQEGMWEHKKGEKVDGGERRKVQVRRLRKLEEMRKERG